MSKFNIEAKQKELAKFENSLKKMSLEELEKLEQEVIAEADKQGEELGKLQFDMPSENYPAVAEAVRKFLNKQSIQWQYTLGMVAMYDFWDPEKRHDEWAAVIAVNKFFEPLQKAYMDATQETFDIASKHDAIMKAMELVSPVKAKATEE